MSANPKPMYKPDYDGPRPEARLSPLERGQFDLVKAKLEQRLYRAALMLTVVKDHNLGGGSSWPDYVQERSDWGAWEREPAVRRFEATPEDHADFLPAMRLMDGLDRTYHKVVFLRALGRFLSDPEERKPVWSWDQIGERFGRSGQWAREIHDRVLIQAARRVGLLRQMPHGHAVVASCVHYMSAPARTHLTTAPTPKDTVNTLRSANAFPLDRAVALWVTDKKIAERIVRQVRTWLEGRQANERRSSWWLASLTEVRELLIEAAQAQGVTWEIEWLLGDRDETGVWTPDLSPGEGGLWSAREVEHGPSFARPAERLDLPPEPGIRKRKKGKRG